MANAEHLKLSGAVFSLVGNNSPEFIGEITMSLPCEDDLRDHLFVSGLEDAARRLPAAIEAAAREGRTTDDRRVLHDAVLLIARQEPNLLALLPGLV